MKMTERLYDQYSRMTTEHPGVLLMMRVGDFYECYGDHAVTLARELEITLTGREFDGVRVPMSGVPYHSVEKYLAKLVQKGFKVAICDLLEDAKTVPHGQIAKRGITRELQP